jgi:hypothetical protein
LVVEVCVATSEWVTPRGRAVVEERMAVYAAAQSV